MTVIDAFVKIGVFRPKDGEVPYEHVVLQRLRKQIVRPLLDHGLHFL